MKLIHGHDFYDHAHAGIDPDVVFVRDGKPDKPITEDDFPFHPQGRRNIRGGIGRRFEPSFDLIYVIAAGTVYPAMLFENTVYKTVLNRPEPVRIRHPTYRYLNQKAPGIASNGWGDFRRSNNGNYDFIYDADEAKLRLEEDLASEGEDWILARAGEVRSAVHDHFHTKNPAWDRWAIEHGVVTGFVAGDLPSAETQWMDAKNFEESVHIEVNLDLLGVAQFFKVKDAFTTFQDIAGFISGVLASQGTNTVEIGNLDKVRKAGFDTKTSFRKAPTKRTG